MLVCKIVGVWNASNEAVTVSTREPPGTVIQAAPGAFVEVTNAIAIPWCNAASDFAAHHLEISVGTRTFQVWQADPGMSERIRLASDGAWHAPGDVIGGYAAVGFLEEATLGNDRVLIAHDATLWMLPPIIAGPLRKSAVDARASAVHISADDDPRREIAVLSVPKSSAVAFSMAGIPSDALFQERRDAPWLYRDSGKRYEAVIGANGIVTVSPRLPPVPSFALPGKLVPPLTEAISFNRKRKGEPIPLPAFDLIAANGGRLFAKEKGTDRLFFAVLDAMFVGADAGRLFAVPSTYFKLDPEAGTPTANPADLTAPMEGHFGRHPAAQRFPLYRLLLPLGFTSMMNVRVWRGLWHLLDARPPSNAMARQLEAFVAQLIPVAQMLATNLPADQGRPFAQSLLNRLTLAQQELPQLLESTPPAPRYDHVQFAGPSGVAWEQSISVASIRDIGVSHVHMHQQYEAIFGGEMQMLSAGPTPGLFATHRELYQFLNGPIADADGFNDGTCNYYLLAQLSDGKFAVLYIDEQTFFSQRWRSVGPDDRGGLLLALTADLAANPGAYQWNRATFWSPFDTEGLVGARSRMAVSAYVILVSGDFQPGSTPPRIYSFNFSWGTMDRSWRWRSMPSGTVARELADPANETVPPEPTDTVYPQTIRVRDDMTLHVRGTKGGVAGRYCQRYLPADNLHVPAAWQLVAGTTPALGYSHPWKFVAEPAFRNADRFSHFGVYDEVDSRTQYHPVDPASFAALDAAQVNADDFWVDVEGKLSITAYPFALDTLQLPWFPWPPFPKAQMKPASLYDDAVLLRFMKRGARWFAVRADKRDDDMVPYDVVPSAPIAFARRGRDGSPRPGAVAVTLQPAAVLPGPPAVRNAFFWWEADGATAGIAYSGSNVARVRMASFDPAGAVVQLFDSTADAFRFDKASGASIFRWAPPPDAAAALRRYANEDGARNAGTSIWFEDLAGHVAPPELVFFRVPLQLRVVPTPAKITYGVPVQMNVRAWDAATGLEIVDPASSIVIDFTPTGHALGETFSYTFEPTSELASQDRNAGFLPPPPRPVPRSPQCLVETGRYPPTPIPFSFSAPARPPVKPKG